MAARVYCLDDYLMYAEMVGMMLTKRGRHQVKVDIVPVLLSSIKQFDPDVIVVNLVRKLESLSRAGITDFYSEVDGAKALREITLQAKEINVPVIITALAVLESDLPYIAFVEIPQKLEQLLHVVDRVVAAKKTGDVIGGM